MPQTDKFDRNLFDFAFYRGPVDQIRPHYPSSAYHSISLATGDSLFIALSDKWQVIQGSDKKDYYFIGSVFEFDKNNPPNSDGHYIGIQVDPQSQTVLFFRGRNSPIGVYYFDRKGIQGVVSVLHRTQKQLDSLLSFPLCSDSIQDLLQHGFVSFGFTPYKNIGQLEFKKRLALTTDGFNLVAEPDLPLDKTQLSNPESLFHFLQSRFAKWWTHTPYKSMAVSGGIDSRFVLASRSLSPSAPSVTLHSRLHPRLSTETDRDVIIGIQLAAWARLPHGVQLSGPFPSAFLSQSAPAQPPVLSGLYGGELLGGDFLNLVHLEPSNLEQPEGRFSSRVRADATEGERTLQDDVRLKLAIFCQASLCDIYQGAWMPIASHHNLTLTPFWDSHLIEVISRLPAQQLRNYQLYRKLFDFLPAELQKLPLASAICLHHPDLPGMTLGSNPKSAELNPHYTEGVIDSRVNDFIPDRLRGHAFGETRLRNLQNFLQKFGFLNS